MSQKKVKAVRVTLELPAAFVKLLDVKVQLSGWLKGEEELDPAGILALLVFMEALGAPEDQIWASTPMMWRSDGPTAVHEERKVIFEEGA